MLGAYHCPYCNAVSACNCDSCKPHIKPNEFVVSWAEDGNRLKCAKCEKLFSLDQSMDTEAKIIKPMFY